MPYLRRLMERGEFELPESGQQNAMNLPSVSKKCGCGLMSVRYW
jgi:hypothetical protein